MWLDGYTESVDFSSGAWRRVSEGMAGRDRVNVYIYNNNLYLGIIGVTVLKSYKSHLFFTQRVGYGGVKMAQSMKAFAVQAWEPESEPQYPCKKAG